MTIQNPISAANTADLRASGAAVLDALTETAHEAGSLAAAKSREALAAMTSEVQRHATTVKDAAADAGAAVAHRMADLADEDSLPGRVVSVVSSSVSDVAQTLRAQDVRGMLTATRDFARRNPLLFVAGVAIAGYAVTRVVRAVQRPSAVAALEDATVAVDDAAKKVVAKATTKARAVRKAAS